MLLTPIFSVQNAYAETVIEQCSGEIVFNEFDTLEVKYKEAVVMKITLPQSGSFKIDFSPDTCWIHEFYLYDENGKLISSDSWSTSRPAITNEYFGHENDLEAGTYYLRYWTGNYKVGQSIDTEFTYYATFIPSKEPSLELIPTIKKGKTLNLSTVLTNSNDKKYTWKSSNTKIATVSSKGVVTGKKKGTVTIKVYNKEGVVGKIKIKVTK